MYYPRISQVHNHTLLKIPAIIFFSNDLLSFLPILFLGVNIKQHFETSSKSGENVGKYLNFLLNLKKEVVISTILFYHSSHKF